MFKKFTTKVKSPFHRRKLGIEDRDSSLDVPSASTVSLNDSISKSAIPPAIPNQSQDTAHSRVNMANQAPVMLRSEKLSTFLLPSQQSALVKAGSVALKGLETALRLLERSAGAFPPLKLAVGGLVACLDLTQVNYLFGFDFLDVVSEVDFRQLSRTVKSMRT